MAWWDSQHRDHRSLGAGASPRARSRLVMGDAFPRLDSAVKHNDRHHQQHQHQQHQHHDMERERALLSPVFEDQQSGPPTAPALVVHVDIRFTDPVIRSRYCRSYGSSPEFDATNRICRGLVRRIERCAEEFITRKDSTALELFKGDTFERKPQRFEMTFRVMRRGKGEWAERIYRSYQKQPLTVAQTREVVLAAHRIVGLFLRRHDDKFRWLDCPEPDAGSCDAGDVAVPSREGPPSLLAVPRSRFIEATQAFEFVPGYSIQLSFRSRNPQRQIPTLERRLKLSSTQTTPLTLFMCEDLLWKALRAVNHGLDQRKRELDEHLRGRQAHQPAHSDDDTLEVGLRIVNNLGPLYNHVRRDITSRLALFRDADAKDCEAFLDDIERRLAQARDEADATLNAMSDLEFRVVELKGVGWALREPAYFTLGPSASYGRRTIQAALDRIQTGIGDVIRGHNIAIHITAHKRGHLVLDKAIVAHEKRGKPRETFPSHEDAQAAIVARLKERVQTDIDKVFEDSCCIDDIPEDEEDYFARPASPVTPVQPEQAVFDGPSPNYSPSSVRSSPLKPSRPGLAALQASPKPRTQRVFSLSRRSTESVRSIDYLRPARDSFADHDSRPSTVASEKQLEPDAASPSPLLAAAELKRPRAFSLVPKRSSSALRLSNASTLAEEQDVCGAPGDAQNQKGVQDVQQCPAASHAPVAMTSGGGATSPAAAAPRPTLGAAAPRGSLASRPAMQHREQSPRAVTSRDVPPAAGQTRHSSMDTPEFVDAREYAASPAPQELAAAKAELSSALSGTLSPRDDDEYSTAPSTPELSTGGSSARQSILSTPLRPQTRSGAKDGELPTFYPDAESDSGDTPDRLAPDASPSDRDQPSAGPLLPDTAAGQYAPDTPCPTARAVSRSETPALPYPAPSSCSPAADNQPALPREKETEEEKSSEPHPAPLLGAEHPAAAPEDASASASAPAPAPAPASAPAPTSVPDFATPQVRTPDADTAGTDTSADRAEASEVARREDEERGDDKPLPTAAAPDAPSSAGPSSPGLVAEGSALGEAADDGDPFLSRSRPGSKPAPAPEVSPSPGATDGNEDGDELGTGLGLGVGVGVGLGLGTEAAPSVHHSLRDVAAGGEVRRRDGDAAGERDREGSRGAEMAAVERLSDAVVAEAGGRKEEEEVGAGSEVVADEREAEGVDAEAVAPAAVEQTEHLSGEPEQQDVGTDSAPVGPGTEESGKPQVEESAVAVSGSHGAEDGAVGAADYDSVPRPLDESPAPQAQDYTASDEPGSREPQEDAAVDQSPLVEPQDGALQSIGEESPAREEALPTTPQPATGDALTMDDAVVTKAEASDLHSAGTGLAEAESSEQDVRGEASKDSATTATGLGAPEAEPLVRDASAVVAGTADDVSKATVETVPDSSEIETPHRGVEVDDTMQAAPGTDAASPEAAESPADALPHTIGAEKPGFSMAEGGEESTAPSLIGDAADGDGGAESDAAPAVAKPDMKAPLEADGQNRDATRDAAANETMILEDDVGQVEQQQTAQTDVVGGEAYIADKHKAPGAGAGNYTASDKTLGPESGLETNAASESQDVGPEPGALATRSHSQLIALEIPQPSADTPATTSEPNKPAPPADTTTPPAPREPAEPAPPHHDKPAPQLAPMPDLSKLHNLYRAKSTSSLRSFDTLASRSTAAYPRDSVDTFRPSTDDLNRSTSQITPQPDTPSSGGGGNNNSSRSNSSSSSSRPQTAGYLGLGIGLHEPRLLSTGLRGALGDVRARRRMSLPLQQQLQQQQQHQFLRLLDGGGEDEGDSLSSAEGSGGGIRGRLLFAAGPEAGDGGVKGGKLRRKKKQQKGEVAGDEEDEGEGDGDGDGAGHSVLPRMMMLLAGAVAIGKIVRRAAE